MKLFPAAMFAASLTAAAAQAAPVQLKDGATWTITAEHTMAADGGGPNQNWSLKTVKRLTWHGGKPSTLTVSPISAVPGSNSPKELAKARSLAIPATLRVGPDLAPGEVVNLDEVRAEFVRLVPNARGADPALIDASTRAMIASEVAMAAQGQGLDLRPGAPVSTDVELANPLGGPPVRAVQTATLETVDKATGAATVKWSQASDPKAFKAAVDAMLKDLGQRQLSPQELADARAALQGAAYENRSDCRYEIDLRTGLARKADCTTTNSVTVQGKTQRVVETWTITQTPPDKT